jgi:hypothetical protein
MKFFKSLDQAEANQPDQPMFRRNRLGNQRGNKTGDQNLDELLGYRIA